MHKPPSKTVRPPAADPYRALLSAHVTQMPPDAYSLLCLELGESDLETIHSAANRKRSALHARKHLADDRQWQLVNVQLEVAISTLTDEEKKHKYDRHLVEACVDRLWMVKDQTVSPYEGDLEIYRTELLAARSNKAKKEKASNGSSLSKKELRKLAAQRRAELAPMRAQIKKIEKRMEQLAGHIETLDGELGNPDLYEENPDKANDLALERGQITKDLEQMEEKWMAASEEYEKAKVI